MICFSFFIIDDLLEGRFAITGNAIQCDDPGLREAVINPFTQVCFRSLCRVSRYSLPAFAADRLYQ